MVESNNGELLARIERTLESLQRETAELERLAAPRAVTQKSIPRTARHKRRVAKKR